MKRDNRQFRDFCRRKGLDGSHREEFKRFLEDGKQTAGGGSANAGGDFTWAELETAYEEFLEVG